MKQRVTTSGDKNVRNVRKVIIIAVCCFLPQDFPLSLHCALNTTAASSHLRAYPLPQSFTLPQTPHKHTLWNIYISPLPPSGRHFINKSDKWRFLMSSRSFTVSLSSSSSSSILLYRYIPPFSVEENGDVFITSQEAHLVNKYQE